MSAPLRPLPIALTLLLGLTACAPASGDGPIHDTPTGGATATNAGSAAASSTASHPTPWDDGWPREWFYAHPRPAEDHRWERIARLVGDEAPALEGLVSWKHSEPVTLDALKGTPVLLKFWATWCGDCKASVPKTAATVERVGDALQVVEVCAVDGGERYHQSVERWGIELPTALDAKGLSEKAYDVPRWPYYVLIDSAGTVRAAGMRTAHVDAAVDHLLALERAEG